MNEQLQALFEGNDFSTEAKDKINVIFESAVEELVESKETEIEQKYKDISEEYAKYLATEYEELTEKYIKEEVIPHVTKYVDYTVSEFVKENQKAIDSEITVNLAESFLGGLSSVTEKFNAKLPEGDYKEEMEKVEEKLTKMNDRFESVLAEKEELQKEINESKKEKVIAPMVADLTESQKEKFDRAIAKVRYIDDEQFKGAASDLFESYFPVNEDKREEEEKTSQKPVNEKTDDDDEGWDWINNLTKQV